MRDVYEHQFSNPKYNNNRVCPHHDYFRSFKLTGSLIDIGTGRANHLKHLGIPILTLDLSKFHTLPLPFMRCDLTTYEGLRQVKELYADNVSCLDVLEHLPQSHVWGAVKSLRKIGAHRYYISVANHSDFQNGHELHLIQKPESWWTLLFEAFFNILEITHTAPNQYFYVLGPA